LSPFRVVYVTVGADFIVGAYQTPIQGLTPYGGDSVTGLINLLHEVIMPQQYDPAYNLAAPVYNNLTEA